jgi:hypothetical protein
MAVRSLGAPNLAIVLAGVCDTSVVGKQGVKALLQNATHSVRNVSRHWPLIKFELMLTECR